MNSPATIARLVDFCKKNVGSFDFQESLIASLFRAILQPGDTVVDGGAHTGRHTETLAALVGTGGAVYALEPLPNLAAGLRQKFQRAAHIAVIQKALSDADGHTRFIFVKNNPSYSGMQATSHLSDAEQVELDVETTTIDGILQKAPTCRLIKLDLEGAEFLALSGASATLEHHSPFLILENGLKQTAIQYGYTKEQFFGLFAESGYRLFNIGGQEVTEEFWESDNAGFDNFVAVKRPEDIRFVQERLSTVLFEVLLEMSEVQAELTKNMVTILGWIAAGNTVALFGAGNRARLLLESYAIPFSFAVDNDAGKAGSSICGIPVRSPEALVPGQAGLKVVIASLWGDEIRQQLLAMQIKPDDILQLNIK